ncbi:MULTISPECIES: hypothetical protein [unclassified Microcoleus]|uniref:hypothetical protein n=1 Tax=unclassified Microcoleus TaxID=2642155 RepID=UPI0025EDD8AB|nr:MULTISPECIES: hypothetical protein [unclassified Microcoleus]
MSGLKATILTVSGVALWLAPPFLLSRKVPLHNLTTGAALIAGFACCFESRKLALKVAEEEEFEALKKAAINADMVDEVSTSVYISEQQRRQEAESILNPVEHLERALALTSDDSDEPVVERSNQLVEPDAERSQNGDAELAERIMQLRARGYGKAKIILEIWGVNKGGSQKYKDAEGEYKRLVGE